MKRIIYEPGVKLSGKRVVALGFFDGVHEGHRVLLRNAKEEAERAGLPFSVYTFISENAPPKKGAALYSTEKKADIFEALGADEMIISDFSSVSEMSAEDFVRKTLASDLGCEVAVSGYDFRFGKGASADAEMLGKLLSECGGKALTVPEQKIDGERISTTKIKELLSSGECERANEMLGAPYSIDSVVTSGLGLGKKLGFPTVNSEFDGGVCHLKKGVYRTVTRTPCGIFSSLTNVGGCPTFEERAPHAETNIIDFDGNLYGEKIRIYFLSYLREEKKFKDQNELILQINIDKNRVIKEKGDIKWQEIGLN